MRQDVELLCGAALLDSGEIEHVAKLLEEHTAVIRDPGLSAGERRSLQERGPASVLAGILREAIRNTFDHVALDMNSLGQIEIVADSCKHSMLGRCLTDALRLAFQAGLGGLDAGDIWRLRCRLEQMPAMAYWSQCHDRSNPTKPQEAKSGISLVQQMEEAKQQGAAERSSKVASAGGTSKAVQQYGHFKEAALAAMSNHAYCAAGVRRAKAAVARALLSRVLEPLAEHLKGEGSTLNKAVPVQATVEGWIATPYRQLPKNRPSA